ncbi:hypothetical protein CHS0354_037306 [Potamilus streckersoni]|uniref:Reverse transcriptase RNase H-like domain-containing protein n=1 Tax=Potamilus streckersoni TaxID=2493646 RepID=A0AAE0TJZ9_9BIVA|nr:hypothetical protein CHS0354_037306 [Potamilus streckersoni]
MNKSLKKHEVPYCITQKELLAIVLATRSFHSCLYGQNVLLRTDIAAVSWIRNFKIQLDKLQDVGKNWVHTIWSREQKGNKTYEDETFRRKASSQIEQKLDTGDGDNERVEATRAVTRTTRFGAEKTLERLKTGFYWPENPERELKLKLAKIIEINKDATIRISQVSAIFNLSRAVEEPFVSLPTTPKGVNLNLSTTRSTVTKTPIIAENAPEALDLSMKNASPLQIPGTASITPKK